ncbi:hypothetical protein [Evansella cellulosilytica]|uniref:Uncharacterized protein n=1 Tax=Evansella cellulosilytica (strain ATCC 21833 / DSM 2522 / FERM P-1141 / JCM 9156 / N-4) TaxID=649639 RepID=E6TWQ8_EVAC2|nr:hypothetical protein [Evansella cellulosilytica]ADU28741.1 hypothetical protein Bcell_0459 [Evansella cellulosilytica DSM 2522]
MRNRIYFLTLHFSSLLLFFFIIRNSPPKYKRFIAPLFISNIGLNYIFEFFVLLIFRGYRYYPNLLKNKYFDNVVGANASQLFVLPTTGLFLTIFHLRKRWSLLFALMLTLVDKLFVEKRLYKHYWWKTGYTPIGVLIFYFIANKWKEQIIDKDHRLFKIFTVYLTNFVAYSTLNFYHVALFKTCLFNIKIFKNFYRSHVVLSTIYSAFCAILFTIIIFLKRGYFTISLIVTLLGLEYIFIKKKLITISTKYFYVISFITKVISIYAGNRIHKTLFCIKDDVPSENLQ